MMHRPPLSAFQQGWLAAADGRTLEDNPYAPDELDRAESYDRAEPVLAADRWRDGHHRFFS